MLMYAGRGDWIGGRVNKHGVVQEREEKGIIIIVVTAAVKPASASVPPPTVGEDIESPRRCEFGCRTRF
jgi:hypothetical protein